MTTTNGEFDDLSTLSLKELSDLEDKVRSAREEKVAASKSEVREAVIALIKDAGFKVSDLFGPSGRYVSTHVSPVAKYANPQDPNETWSGRGRKPRWLADLLDGGRRIEEFLIAPAAPPSGDSA